MNDAATTSAKFKPVGAVLQTIRLLRVLAASGRPMGVSAAARAASVNTSTAFNVLRTLAAEGLATFDPDTKNYALGPGVYELAKGFSDERVVDLLRGEIVRLASEADCLVALWQVADERLILIDRAVADRPVRLDMAITQRMPLLLGALGRAVAAAQAMPAAQVRKQFPKLRWQHPLSVEQYLADIATAQQQGYAVDRGVLYDGIVTVACAITDADGIARYGISAIELVHRIDDARVAAIGDRLAATCAKFSRTAA